ncbi:MAG: hypothetical protein ABS68_04550 [Niastella sp. SCN 39-18]|nr:hypothetical protein [Sphingobacteriales bacterium]ODT53615.1 MAG: hypothetical protein ABS68_04550 [Niastella sp. SCN 39-18]OJW09372.1 MAG: hypothetical protein BGO53_02915 [Sphingobacteriales bacterium 39-19]
MKKLLFATCFILAFASCKKEKHGPPPDNPYGLPNATTEGKNIFACRVNGQNWISETGIYNMGGGHPVDTVWASGKVAGQSYYERFVVRVDGNAIEGNTYTVAPNSSAKIFFQGNRDCTCPNGGCSVATIYATSGQITVTKINSQSEIISGKFECKIPVPLCDTLLVTNGRFDISY